MSLDAFLFILVLVFLVALCGTFVGLAQAWPKDGRGWEWRRTRLLMASAVALVAVVACFIAVTISLTGSNYGA